MDRSSTACVARITSSSTQHGLASSSSHIRRRILAPGSATQFNGRQDSEIMRYPIAIEIGTATSAYGVAVPDLPGCFSAGDTLDEAIAAAEEAALAWIDTSLDAGDPVPAPSSVDKIRTNPDYDGWAFGVINIDPAAFDDTVERVNITLPRRILLRLDAQARAAGETRSGYIAHMAMGNGRNRAA